MTASFLIGKQDLFQRLHEADTHERRMRMKKVPEPFNRTSRCKKRKGPFAGRATAAAKRAAMVPIDKRRMPVQLVEHIDMIRMRWLLDNRDSLKDEAQTELTKLLNLSRQLDDSGKHTVTYARKAHGFGRHYPQYGERSLQGISKRLRSTLAERYYFDVDIVNSHPVILQAVCRKNGWLCPALDAYIRDREGVLNSIPLERRIAKRLVLTQMYGGNIRAMLARENMLHKYGLLPPFVKAFHNELRTIGKNVYRSLPDFAHVADEYMDSTNKSASCLSLMLQHYEDCALQVATAVIQERGWEVGAFIHDGFLLRRRPEDPDKLPSNGLLNALSHQVKRELGFSLRFTVKPFTSAYEINE